MSDGQIVSVGSPTAQSAGLQRGDIILGVGGRDVPAVASQVRDTVGVIRWDGAWVRRHQVGRGVWATSGVGDMFGTWVGRHQGGGTC